ncbi:MAG TPA: hypothetical protein VNL14_06250 [Candidatus Acidoferrales bacterium]|nr:hypothetical protein [Candidatus Acidoferrales bacterium]
MLKSTGLIFVCLLALAGCSSKAVPDSQYVPAGGLLDILKDFQRLAREDLYRFPISKDVTGMNVMKATLLRLEDYEKKNPRRFPDIVAFTKGTAYEKLRDYERALAYYRKVAEQNGRLGEESKQRIAALEAFRQIIETPLSADDPFAYLEALDQKVASWNELVKKYQGTPYEFLARVEEERVDRAKVTFVELNRHRIKNGNDLVIVGYSQLIAKHRQSKNYYRHLIDFGDFYVTLAKDYVAQHDPEGLDFDAAVFDQLAKSALKLYTEVARVDGIVEKIEAQGKIEALRGLTEKVKRLNQ